MTIRIQRVYRYQLVRHRLVLRAISGSEMRTLRARFGIDDSLSTGIFQQTIPAFASLLRSIAAHRRRSPSPDAGELIALSALLTSLGLFLRLGFLGGLLGLLLAATCTAFARRGSPVPPPYACGWSRPPPLPARFPPFALFFFPFFFSLFFWASSSFAISSFSFLNSAVGDAQC